MGDSPNAAAAAWSVVTSLITVDPPNPRGSGRLAHVMLAAPLRHLGAHGVDSLPDLRADLIRYLGQFHSLDPNHLDTQEALAFWINIYNAGALVHAADALRLGESSVLRIPGGFRRPFITVAGESLSLDNIEHGKVRRFRDPRVHAALVCGSISCPTLRSEPYAGASLSDQLDDQLSHLLATGAVVADHDDNVVNLSRIFLWFGADFVRPERMPTLVPARPRSVVNALSQWLDPETVDWLTATEPEVRFLPYDWGLSCTVR